MWISLRFRFLLLLLLLILLSPRFISYLDYNSISQMELVNRMGKIEVKNKQAEAIPDHTIEIRDACLRGSMQAGNAICGRAPCGFTDRGIGTKDAKERQMSMRKLILVVLMCAIFMSVEVFGGIRANSLAILTDAAHLLSDIVAFAISLFSIWASGWEATPYQSYGFFRMEVLGALASIQLIWLLTGILVYQAISRLLHDAGKVEGHLMFAVAAFGFVVNIAMALMLHHKHEHGLSGHANGCSDHGYNHAHAHGHGDGVHGHNHHDITITADDDDVGHSKHKDDDHETLLKNQECADHVDRKNSQKRQNINIHSAYLHVLGDSIQSVGVMIGGAIIWYKPEWKIIDLICTLIFSIIVLGTTINMLRNILEVLMESTPREIDVMRLEKGLCDMDGVLAIHELHIWSITVGKVLLSCHLTITPDADADLLLGKVVGYIKREYNIANATIQMERT